MGRLPKLETSDMSASQRAVHDAITAGPRGKVGGPLAVWLHRPGLADNAQKLGQYCRYDSSLPPRLSELAILTTARIWDARYEWDAHVPHALKGGVAQSIVDALAADEDPEFAQADEAAVYAVARELNLTRTISDELYSDAQQVLGRDGLVDLIGVLGYYSLISMTIKAFEVES